jgi:hypothetical protein
MLYSPGTLSNCMPFIPHQSLIALDSGPMAAFRQSRLYRNHDRRISGHVILKKEFHFGLM